jgi:NADPH-dependent 2,4-dienoyl-CoA reductase/sulfur reductase-like enzyme
MRVEQDHQLKRVFHAGLPQMQTLQIDLRRRNERIRRNIHWRRPLCHHYRLTAKRQNPRKSFLMIKEEEKGLVPCGIPYVFHDLEDVSKNMMGPAPFVAAGGEVVVDKVIEVDFSEKLLRTAKGEQFGYDKLVFATGSIPLVPKFIKGYDLQNVEYIRKSYDYIKALKDKTDAAKEIVVIGGGFIGVEVAEQLAKHEGKRVHLIEVRDHCLSAAFSEKLTSLADETIRRMGIDLKTGTKVMEITGENGIASGVILSDGTKLSADLIISSIGYSPNTVLARQAGLAVNKNGAIKRDNYMRTATKDVYAVGDCSESIGFITGREDNIMLASTATAEARILGYNLFGINLIRTFSGTLSVFSTDIGGKVFASAGAIQQVAEEAEIEYVCGSFEDVDRHPESMAMLPGLD